MLEYLHYTLFSFQQLQQRPSKRKLDNSSTGANNPDQNHPNLDQYAFDDSEPTQPNPKKLKHNKKDRENSDSQLASLSVQIVQKITPQPEHSQTIHTNVTVSSIGSRTSTGSPHTGTTNIQTSTNIECKREPQDDPQCSEANPNSAQPAFPDPLPDLDVEELFDILDKGEELPQEIIDELDKFQEVCDTVTREQERENEYSTSKDQMNVFANVNKGSPGMFGEPVGGGSPMNQMYDAVRPTNPNMVNMGASAQMPSYRAPPPPGPQQAQVPPAVLDTGPAAETLKQMAAQHQQQTRGDEPNGYAKGPSPFVGDVAGADIGRYPGRGYPPTYPEYNAGLPRPNPNMYPYNQQPPMNNMSEQMPQMGMARAYNAEGVQDRSLTYGSTKPLTHYPEPVASATPPSSLDALQNQVRQHFGANPGQGQPAPGTTPQMHITQSQHMQMTHGPQRMQMSQTQQLQVMPQVQQISMAQQQSFSLSQQQQQAQQQNMPTQQNQGQYMNDPMKMQMYQEKLRREQQHREHKLREQQMMEQQRQQQAAHMNMNYMNRPPPEYKMQQQQQQGQPPQQGAGNGGATPVSYPQGAMNANPLQTMQNMVNQTKQPIGASGVNQNGLYTTVKTEIGPSGQGQARSSPLNNMPPNSINQNLYAANQMTNQSAASVTMPTRPTKQETPTYTSAIMRNQRPPNVNVGPDGLNISQQRPQNGEWPRPPMMPNSQGAPPQGGQMAQMQRPPMSSQQQAGMMPYRNYSPSEMNMQSAQRMQMQQQQRAQGPPHPGQPHPGMVPGQGAPGQQGAGTQAMMVQSPEAQMQHQQQQQQQQQRQMRMQHPNNGNINSMTNMSISTSVSMSTASQQQQQQTNQNQGFPATSNGSDFPLDFLDNAQNSDFFDSNPSEFNLIDEIFGK